MADVCLDWQELLTTHALEEQRTVLFGLSTYLERTLAEVSRMVQNMPLSTVPPGVVDCDLVLETLQAVHTLTGLDDE